MERMVLSFPLCLSLCCVLSQCVPILTPAQTFCFLLTWRGWNSQLGIFRWAGAILIGGLLHALCTDPALPLGSLQLV